jgi:hypothetical protein
VTFPPFLLLSFGLPVNLQVLHFIQASGGRLFRGIAEIKIPEIG